MLIVLLVPPFRDGMGRNLRGRSRARGCRPGRPRAVLSCVIRSVGADDHGGYQSIVLLGNEEKKYAS